MPGFGERVILEVIASRFRRLRDHPKAGGQDMTRSGSCAHALRRARLTTVVLCAVGGILVPDHVLAGSARDYLNAPIDSWLAFYNAGYNSSVTPEDGLDVASRIRTNVVSQSVVLTRTMDYWGRTGGLSICAALSLRGIEFWHEPHRG